MEAGRTRLSMHRQWMPGSSPGMTGSGVAGGGMAGELGPTGEARRRPGYRARPRANGGMPPARDSR